MHTTTAGQLEDGSAEVNISPLIDMVFILLIFFIVTTVFVDENGTKVAGPDAVAGDAPALVLTLTAGNQILHQGNVVTPGSVVTLVRNLMTTEPTAVVLEVEPTVSAQRVVTVIDSARLGGALDVSLMSAR